MDVINFIIATIVAVALTLMLIVSKVILLAINIISWLAVMPIIIVTMLLGFVFGAIDKAIGTYH